MITVTIPLRLVWLFCGLSFVSLVLRILDFLLRLHYKQLEQEYRRTIQSKKSA
jgi:hypothetical protein